MLESLPILPSFLAILNTTRVHFARREAYENFAAIAYGWVMALGKGTVSSALVAGDLVELKHWSAFYRVFSRASWSIDKVGLQVAALVIERLVPEGVITLVVDDTLHSKGGKHVFGAGMHHDALASTRKTARFQYGHCWVVLSVVVRIPFALRPRALPVLFRLNIPKKKVDDYRVQHAKKTEQANEIIELIARAFPDRQFELTGDGLYSCRTVLQALPSNVVMVGKLDLEAALYGPCPERRKEDKGRPRKWGARTPNPTEVAENGEPWLIDEMAMYGRTVTVRYKTFTAWWESAGSDRELRCVVVWRPNGQWPYDAFLSTEPEHTPRHVLERYAERWCCEPMHHETADSLGVDHGQPWNPKAVRRTAPSAMLLYSMVVLWYVEHGRGTAADIYPRRPWYRHKINPSFADMLATLRRATLHPRLFTEVARNRPPEKLEAARDQWMREAA